MHVVTIAQSTPISMSEVGSVVTDDLYHTRVTALVYQHR